MHYSNPKYIKSGFYWPVSSGEFPIHLVYLHWHSFREMNLQIMLYFKSSHGGNPIILIYFLYYLNFHFIRKIFPNKLELKLWWDGIYPKSFLNSSLPKDINSGIWWALLTSWRFSFSSLSLLVTLLVLNEFSSPALIFLLQLHGLYLLLALV